MLTTPRYALPYGDPDTAMTRLDTLIMGGWSPDLNHIVAATRTFAYNGGYASGGYVVKGTIVIPDASTKYVQRTLAGVVSADAALDATKIPMAIVTTAGGLIANFEDIRDLFFTNVYQALVRNPMTTAGDLIIGGAAGVQTRLPVGANGQVLSLVTGAPAWSSPATGGGVTVDPYWDMVVMLAHLDVNPGTDKKGHTLTRTGTGLTTGTALGGGTWNHPYGALWPFSSFAGGTDKIVIDVTTDIARLRKNQNFTIEFDFNTATGTTGSVMWTHMNGNANSGSLICGINTATNNGFVYMNSVGQVSLIGTHSFRDSHWHHFRGVRSWDCWRIFVDGALEAFSDTANGGIGDFTSNFTIGGVPVGTSGGGVAFVGYLSEARYTIGQARAGIAFNAPTSAYPDG